MGCVVRHLVFRFNAPPPSYEQLSLWVYDGNASAAEVLVYEVLLDVA
mgnify:CR=1 FL=1